MLAVDRLPEADRARFAKLDLGIATLSPQELGKTLPEPDPSWNVAAGESLGSTLRRRMTTVNAEPGIALRLAPALTVAVLILPVSAGVAGVALPAFGYLPALGGTRFTLAPWHALMAMPRHLALGARSASRPALVTALCSFLLVQFFVACLARDAALLDDAARIVAASFHAPRSGRLFARLPVCAFRLDHAASVTLGDRAHPPAGPARHSRSGGPWQ